MTVHIVTRTRFVAGLVLVGGHVTQAAPILRYMMGWTLPMIERHAKWHKWAVEVLP